LNIWLAGLALLLTISILGVSSQAAFAGVPQSVSVDLVKEANKQVIVNPTDVQFKYTIINDGSDFLICTSLFDSNLGELIDVTPGNDDIGIAPGNNLVIFKTGTVTTDPSNSATVQCRNSNFQQVSSTDILTLLIVDPTATLLKTPLKTQVVDGQQITYDFKATRTDTDNVNLISCQITDATIGYASAFFALPAQNSMFGPDTSGLVTIDFPGLTNTATLDCTIDTTMGDPFSVLSNEVTVDVVDIEGLTLDKMVTKNQVVANQQVGYSFQADNSAGTFDLKDCEIVDLDLPFTSAMFDLDAGAVSAVIPGPQNVPIPSTSTNTATVTCDEPITMQEVSATDSETVTVVNIGGLELVKTVNDQDCSDPDNAVMVPEGTDVTFMFKATNTNLNFMYMDCQINDPMLGGNLGATFDLAAGGGMNTDVTEVVTINADMWNTATIECMEDVTMQDVMATSNVCHVEIQDMPCVDLQKMVNPSLIDQGETVKYIYDAINCGDVALTNCNITDDNGTPVNLNDDFPVGDVDFPIPVGNSIPLPFEIMKEINMNTKNTATIICTAGQQPVEDMDMATVTIITVGGEFLSIDTTALFLGGIQSTAVWILPTVAGLAGAGYYLVKFRNKED